MKPWSAVAKNVDSSHHPSLRQPRGLFFDQSRTPPFDFVLSKSFEVVMVLIARSLMYCIERLDSGGQWIQEICFKTEFKAFVNARTKSRATLKTYRVVHATWNQVVTVVQGSNEFH